MKRLEFVRNISLIGAGISLAPIQLFSNNSNCKVYRLPKATVHIPHGNFAACRLDNIDIPELDLSITHERFMKHGIDSSSNDLSIITVSRGNESLIWCYGYKRAEVSGEISGLKIQSGQTRLTLTTQKYELLLNQKSSDIQITEKRRSLF